MANVCKYEIIVKGAKNACYAFYGSMPMLNDKGISSEYGADDDYLLHFFGDCKWGVNAYAKKWDESYPKFIPFDPDEAYLLGEQYQYLTLRDKSIIFDVSIWCKSYDADEGNENDAVLEAYSSGEHSGDAWPEVCVTDENIETEWNDDEDELTINLELNSFLEMMDIKSTKKIKDKVVKSFLKNWDQYTIYKNESGIPNVIDIEDEDGNYYCIYTEGLDETRLNHIIRNVIEEYDEAITEINRKEIDIIESAFGKYSDIELQMIMLRDPLSNMKKDYFTHNFVDNNGKINRGYLAVHYKDIIHGKPLGMIEGTDRYEENHLEKFKRFVSSHLDSISKENKKRM